MAERQYGTKYSDIRADHIGRYEWAANFVSGDVLDAACGSGYGSHYLATHSKSVVTGIDIDREAISFAATHWCEASVSFKIGDVQSLNCKLPAKDWIVSFETIEHLDAGLGVLKRFAICAPKLVVSVPNELTIPFDKKRFPFHVRHYTADQFVSSLDEAGWYVDGLFTQADNHTRIPKMGADGRTIIAVCTRKDRA